MISLQALAFGIIPQGTGRPEAGAPIRLGRRGRRPPVYGIGGADGNVALAVGDAGASFAGSGFRVARMSVDCFA